MEECRRYVVAKLNGKEMTAALIQKHVLHWSWQMVKKRDDTEPQIRHTSLDTPARYYREVRKLLMGK